MSPSGPKGSSAATRAGVLSALLCLFCAPVAHAAPRVLSAELGSPPSAGAPSTLRMRSVDRDAPATSLVANFGGRDGLFGLDACRAGTKPSGPFRPGARNTLSAPHAFSGTAARQVLVRLGAGTCNATAGSLLQPLTVTPVKPGAKPVAVLLGTPVTLPPGVEPPAVLPGLGALPSLPSLPSVTSLLRRASSSPAASAPRCKGAKGTPGRSRSRARKAVLCLINVERGRRGLRGLRANPHLLKAAVRHSKSMVSGGFFSHVEPGGLGLTGRLTRTRYITPRVRWQVGENLGYGTGRRSTPAAIVDAWMNSAPHRANILDGTFRDLGTGIVAGVPGARGRGFTYTANFGRRR